MLGEGSREGQGMLLEYDGLSSVWSVASSGFCGVRCQFFGLFFVHVLRFLTDDFLTV